jgi:hypothetical protein
LIPITLDYDEVINEMFVVRKVKKEEIKRENQGALKKTRGDTMTGR